MVQANNFKTIITALLQADYLRSKDQVVIANPPHIGDKGMNGKLKS
jgi:hypothetical protein